MSLLLPSSIAARLRGGALLLGFAAFFAQAAGLPATGQITCYNAQQSIPCDDPEYPRQDASTAAGSLAYTKLDSAGNALAPAASDWVCTRDNATGLVWEVKTVGGMRDRDHLYAWSNPDMASNGGDAGGTTETSYCQDSLAGQACTTTNYVAALNAANLCGGSGWRLPTQRELLTLIHAGALKPAVDINFFPDTRSEVYWAANTYARIPPFAWGVHFSNGAANADYKTRPYRVRLVRGQPF